MGKWTRRGFITAGVIAGGGLIVGASLPLGHRAPKLAHLVAGSDETLVSAWVKLDNNNMLTVIAPHSDMGQGAQTALAQMLADELDADWNLVNFQEAPAVEEYANYPLVKGFITGDLSVPKILAPSLDGLFFQTSKAFDLQITGGSTSVALTGVYGMRVAGAAVREMLQQAAAEAWQVPAEEITMADSYLSHSGTNRQAKYADFATAAAALTPPTSPKLKATSEFKIMGKSAQRLDIPAKVDGSANFALDIELPNMLYATVTRAPVFGAKLQSLDDKVARKMPGVVDIFTLPSHYFEDDQDAQNGDTVAVVAEGFWQAKQAMAALQIKWSNSGNESVSSDSIFRQYSRDLDKNADRETDRDQGDVATALASAAQIVEAEYRVPFLAHACMEPLNATARVQDGRCDLWIGCQNPLGFKTSVAEALQLQTDKVTVHNQIMGGGFGRKAINDWGIQAALIAARVDRPVQLVWTREEDTRQDFYRPSAQSRFRAAVDNRGQLLSWENTYVNKMEPATAPLIPYSVAAQDIGYVDSPTHVPLGPWRSVDHSQHSFFTESFIDEVAAASGADAYQYRLDLLRDKPRHIAVLKKAAQKAQWDTPISSGNSSSNSRGRGIAIQESFGSIVAQVVEVTVSGGNISVDRVVAVIDAGFAVSPDGMTAQIESGIMYGLSAALYGEISIANGAVVESNFHDYQALRITDAPIIETHIINSGEAWGGAGEPGTPPIAPALANAIYNATGVRIRQLPLKNIDIFNNMAAAKQVSKLTMS